MVEKSPLIIEQYEDSLASLSDDYSDLLALYAENAKLVIQQLSESTDNGPQKAQEILAILNGKLELAELMKDSLNGIGKIANTSKFYL